VSEPAGVSGVLRKILLTAAAGGGAYALTTLSDQPTIWGLTMSIFIGGVSLVTQFLVDFDTRLAMVDHRQQEEFAKINQATELYSRVEASSLDTDTVIDVVQYATRVDLRAKPLLGAFIESQLRDAAEMLKSLTISHAVDYPGEGKDWLFSLVENVRRSVKATSTMGPTGRGLVDEGYWSTQNAAAYLDRQKDAVRRGVSVRRIFIALFPEQVQEAHFREAVQLNLEANVEVRVLNKVPSSFGNADFVLLDDEISYEFSSRAALDGDRQLVRDRVELTLAPATVLRRRLQFDEWWERATPVPAQSPA
jgi:hypothetical protein